MEEAARRARRRARGREEPEPSLGRRLAMIGVLGWTVVVPTLLGLWVGRFLDRALDTGIQFSAALLVAGAAFGLWSAWRWMNRQ